jgi:hypothetical protein
MELLGLGATAVGEEKTRSTFYGKKKTNWFASQRIPPS